jgi:hypothetical protein
MTGRAAVAALLIFASGVYAVSVAAPQARAAAGSGACGSTGSGGTSGAGGSESDGVISVWASLTSSSQSHLCQGTSTTGYPSNVTPPPACWWEPEFSPPQLAAAIAQYAPSSSEQTFIDYDGEYADKGENVAVAGDYVSTSGPTWQDFNINANPGGTWWGLYYNEYATAGFSQCTAIFDNVYPENWFWVANGAAANPPAGTAMTARDLAEYVAGKVALDPITVQSNPDLTAGTKTTVGLATWLWADGGGNTTVKFQICTQEGPICVNVAAQAVRFTVTTGDHAATVFSPCKANKQGVIGKPYATGDNGNPPCGITFRTPGTWPVAMVTSWDVRISWAGGALPLLEPLPQTETDLTARVQAIQAVNN